MITALPEATWVADSDLLYKYWTDGSKKVPANVLKSYVNSTVYSKTDADNKFSTILNSDSKYVSKAWDTINWRLILNWWLTLWWQNVDWSWTWYTPTAVNNGGCNITINSVHHASYKQIWKTILFTIRVSVKINSVWSWLSISLPIVSVWYRNISVWLWTPWLIDKVLGRVNWLEVGFDIINWTGFNSWSDYVVQLSWSYEIA